MAGFGYGVRSGQNRMGRQECPVAEAGQRLYEFARACRPGGQHALEDGMQNGLYVLRVMRRSPAAGD
jgi:hypothetical protein